jgi:hypothetical protein
MVPVLLSFCLALSALGGGGARAAPVPAGPGVADRILIIDPSSMSVAAGQATLSISGLRRAHGVYSGDYKMKVFPYFLKSEKGRLAISVSDAALATVNQGQVSTLTGTATTTGKTARTRPVTATVTPVDRNHGTLRLWFTAGGRKMVFEPAYHFSGEPAVATTPPPPGPPPSPRLATSGAF